MHWAPSRTTRVLVLAWARRFALLLVAACGLLSHRKRLACGLCTETDRFDKKEVKIVFLNCRKAQNSFCRRHDVGLPAKRNTENYDQLVIIISLICINTNETEYEKSEWHSISIQSMYVESWHAWWPNICSYHFRVVSEPPVIQTFSKWERNGSLLQKIYEW